MAVLPAGGKYDLVIFGATGYTGQFVVEEVARIAAKEKESNASLTWAVAGRSKDKLDSVLEAAKSEVDFNTEQVGMIIANVSDEESIENMAKQAKVLINCVGPYHLYGEPVVKACIEHGSSHVDISGEPVFLEGMQLKYDAKAEEANVHIVGACGYDSVPADMGVAHMVKMFPGELNSVETYVTFRNKGAKTSIHTGTMESAVLAMQNRAKFNEIRKQLFPKKLPRPKFQIEKRKALHHNALLNLWAVPLPTDEAMVYRTQRYRHDVEGLRPIQYKGYLGVKTAFQGVGTLLGMIYFAFLAYFSLTRSLLLKYPEVMTAGVFTRAGSDKKSLKKCSFTSTLVGNGWSEKSSEHSSPPEKKVILQITGPDPGYGATSLMLVASAMTILKEKTLCTRSGGVMTPGMAFSNTTIIKRLEERDMKIVYIYK